MGELFWILLSAMVVNNFTLALFLGGPAGIWVNTVIVASGAIVLILRLGELAPRGEEDERLGPGAWGIALAFALLLMLGGAVLVLAGPELRQTDAVCQAGQRQMEHVWSESIRASLARELAPRSVLVNAVAPGFIETSMTEGLPEKARQKKAKRDERRHPTDTGDPHDPLDEGVTGEPPVDGAESGADDAERANGGAEPNESAPTEPPPG